MCSPYGFASLRLSLRSLRLCGEWTAGAPINLDHRRVFHHDALFQRIYDPEPRRPVDGGLRRGAPHGHYPRLVKKELGTAHGGIERQSVIGGERFPQRDGEAAIHTGEIAEPGAVSYT